MLLCRLFSIILFLFYFKFYFILILCPFMFSSSLINISPVGNRSLTCHHICFPLVSKPHVFLVTPTSPIVFGICIRLLYFLSFSRIFLQFSNIHRLLLLVEVVLPPMVIVLSLIFTFYDYQRFDFFLFLFETPVITLDKLNASQNCMLCIVC